MAETKKPRGSGASGYASQEYWRKRSDMLYYRYIDHILRHVGAGADSLIDVGTGNCPYLDWWDWIPHRVSVDIRVPYKAAGVTAIKGDIHQLTFAEPFDICTCLQVLEHVPEAQPFARRLLELGKLVIVSVPYNWPDGPRPTPGHVHDPVDYAKLTGWMGREADYRIIVTEPSGKTRNQRLIAFYHRQPQRRLDRLKWSILATRLWVRFQFPLLSRLARGLGRRARVR